MSISNVAQIVAAYDAGQSFYATWRKTPTQTTVLGPWFDLSMSPGNPVPNYYAATPLNSVAMAASTDGGIPHGPAVSPKTKYLHKFMAMCQAGACLPFTAILCDYLLYYPFVDMSVVDVQSLTTGTTLPRYADGVGVEMMAVLVAPQLGGSTFSVTYTNQAGVSGRTTQVLRCNTQVVNGTIVHTSSATVNAIGPFMPLQGNDTGVRKIDSVTFATGDVGLLAFVLVKPIATVNILDITAPVEKDYLIDFNTCPVIQDDAYLNLICCPGGTLASAGFNGEIQTYWTT